MERLLRCWLCPIFYLNGDFACIWLMYLLVCKLHLTFSHTHKNCNNSKDFNCNACNLWLSSPFIQFMITQSIYSPDAWMPPQPFLSSDWPLLKNWSHAIVTHERGNTLIHITGEPLSFMVMFLSLSAIVPPVPNCRVIEDIFKDCKRVLKTNIKS